MSHSAGAHAHTHDHAEANREHFDKIAHKYDDVPGAQELGHRLGGAMLKAYPFDENTTTVLDFACGTGLISRELAPFTKSIVGVDISQGMVDQYNLRVSNQGIPPEEMKAVRVELKGEEGELDGAKFDVVVCSVAYHHFTSMADVTRALSFFLKAGGWLMVTDFFKDADAHFVPSHLEHTVPHAHGVDIEELQGVFESAGLAEFTYERVTSAKFHGNDVHFFLAKGIKPRAV